MLSFKRFLGIILTIVILSVIFLIYNINESRPASVHNQTDLGQEREFIEICQVDEGERTRVWLLGKSESEPYRQIYDNVWQFCADVHLTVVEENRLDLSKTEERDLVIFCDAAVGRYADLTELEEFIAGGGRVILAAGNSEPGLWPLLGIQENSAVENYHNLLFEKPLLPVQPEQVYYGGDSASARLVLSDDAFVYIRDAITNVPILYTRACQKGYVCLINGTFLSDIRCLGLLTGAAGTVLPDFIYPILGVKSVFLDDFPMFTAADDELCRRVYGYSTQGFIRDVLWPAFQGASLRTDTPYTSSILAAASSADSFGAVGEELFTVICKSALQFGWELVYAADCSEAEKLVFNRDFIEQFPTVFTNYTIQGLALESDNFFPEMLAVPGGAEIKFVRGLLTSQEARLSWHEGLTVFPAATVGNSIDDGNLFLMYSMVGAYGLVSHVFDVSLLITKDEQNGAWDFDKRHIGIFESEVLAKVPWLEGKTLSQTAENVRSYQDLAWGWTKSDNRLELNCSGAVRGQAFFYHTAGRIVRAEGLTYQEIGNGYYLLRVQESKGVIMLEVRK